MNLRLNHQPKKQRKQSKNTLNRVLQIGASAPIFVMKNETLSDVRITINETVRDSYTVGLYLISIK